MTSEIEALQAAIARLARMFVEDLERFDSERFFRRIAERAEQQAREEPI